MSKFTKEKANERLDDLLAMLAIYKETIPGIKDKGLKISVFEHRQEIVQEVNTLLKILY